MNPLYLSTSAGEPRTAVASSNTPVERAVILNIDKRNTHARTGPRAGVRVNQHQPLLLLAISHTLKRLGVPHRVESGEPSAADRKAQDGRMIVMPRGVFSGRPIPRVPLQVPPIYPTSPRKTRKLEYVRLRGVSAYKHGGSAALMGQPPLLTRRDANTALDRGLVCLCHSTSGTTTTTDVRGGKLSEQRPRGRGQAHSPISWQRADLLAARGSAGSERRAGGGGWMEDA